MNAESHPTIFRAVELDVLSPRTGRARLSGLTMDVKAGEILTVLGRYDSGREALRDVMARVLPRYGIVAGKVTLGERINGKRPRFAYLASPSLPALSPHARADKQLVRILARRAQLSRSRARDELADTLTHLPSAPTLERLQVRRSDLGLRECALAFFALALAQKADAILADDPAAGLDPAETVELLALLNKEQVAHGFALIYFTGDPRVPLWLGGRCVVLRDGRLIEDGPVEQLAGAKARPYTQTLFASVPRLGHSLAQTRLASRSEPLLQVRNLVFDKPSIMPVRPLEGVTFDLRRGASLALIGTHGSGRHAIVEAVLGLSPPWQGRVVFDSVDVAVLLPEMRARLRRRVAYITGDDRALDSRMTIYETVAEPMRAHVNLGEKENKSAAASILKRVGLGNIDPRRRTAELSPLDRRRVQIARALAGGPQLVVLYEPLDGLDALSQAVILDLLKEFRRREGAAFIVVTANFAVAETLADEALVLQDGDIVERGLIAELIRAPKNPQTKAMIAAVSPPASAGLSLESTEG